MEITALRLLTAHLDAQRAFYTGTLGLPLVSETINGFTVRAGTTRLTFTASDTDARYHFAFNVPNNVFTQAKAFLAARVSLLIKNGQDQFHSDDWNADMIYFADAAGNIAEYIARRTLADDAPGDFTPAAVCNVSEIGLPVDDVPTIAAVFTARLGVAPYGEQEEQFAPVGDERGLFIVVRAGRHWFPTTTGAIVSPIAVTLRGAREDTYNVPNFPYHIDVTRG